MDDVQKAAAVVWRAAHEGASSAEIAAALNAYAKAVRYAEPEDAAAALSAESVSTIQGPITAAAWLRARKVPT